MVFKGFLVVWSLDGVFFFLTKSVYSASYFMLSPSLVLLFGWWILFRASIGDLLVFYYDYCYYFGFLSKFKLGVTHKFTNGIWTSLGLQTENMWVKKGHLKNPIGERKNRPSYLWSPRVLTQSHVYSCLFCETNPGLQRAVETGAGGCQAGGFRALFFSKS